LGIILSPIEQLRAEAEHINSTKNTLKFPKQERYKQPNGLDWIDKCADSFTEEEFRGAMKFTIGKYLERLGKKDNITLEVTKVADYATRWLEYEKSKEEIDGL
jgi:hypothetical protein